jgi:hypothetical protein
MLMNKKEKRKTPLAILRYAGSEAVLWHKKSALALICISKRAKPNALRNSGASRCPTQPPLKTLFEPR